MKSNLGARHHGMALIAGTSMCLVGCASVSITSSTLKRSMSPADKEVQVTIKPFSALGRKDGNSTQYLDTDNGHITLGAHRPPQVNKLGRVVADSLAKYLQERNITATVSETRPRHGVWVSGQLTQEIEGSRALRSVIGLGVGKSLLESRILIYNLDKSGTLPWLTAATSGGSNREPGAIFSAMPSPMLAFNIAAVAGTTVSLALHGQKGLTQDAGRTGRSIGALLHSEILKAKGRTPSVHPKRAGQISHPLGGHNINVPFSSRRHAHSETQFLEKNH